VAVKLLDGGKEDAELAVKLSLRACELTHYRWSHLLNTLANAQSRAGQMDASLATSELANNLVINGGESDSRVKFRENLAAKLRQEAWALATSPRAELRNGPRAVQLAQRAWDMTQFDQTSFISTLAAAYAEAGDFDKATATEQSACELAAKKGETNLVQTNRLWLELYRAHKPLREGN
jgi:Flp pilus assembly protein TadD